jgi:hypothetical protein
MVSDSETGSRSFAAPVEERPSNGLSILVGALPQNGGRLLDILYYKGHALASLHLLSLLF